ncbi:TonB-dependent receptor [Algibacter sp. L4_22]|uniref:SusC/RagA family TonB-linked outer membrane protein n=1 Tax=Algibacter sp. L4_22 TaxID=2942477 RepID=UPI00201B73DF|nr:TonB-dependent receptor [Algibacter sp. L4_22]MCL5129275.1 TonB-dependent receptor [Algibacter sp. L4_22]
MKKTLTKTKRRTYHSGKFDLKMKLTAVFFLFTLFSLQAKESYAQRTKVSLNLENVSISEFIDEVESTSQFRFIYKVNDVNLKRLITLKAKNEKIDSILERVFKDTDVSFNFKDRLVYLVKRKNTESKPNEKSATIQKYPLTGKILDENNVPLPGASIIEKGTSNGVTTDFDGNFSISLNTSNAIIAISYVGYETQEISIDNQKQIEIQLKQDTSLLEEVLIVGYTAENRKNVTASVASISPAEINTKPVANVAEMLEGRLPGIQIMSDNSPGGGTSIRVRGFSTINNNDPLVVVDGVPVSNGLDGINPTDIETIQVLKDAASSSIYGSRAANGVVVITTKKGSTKGSFETTLNIYNGLQASFNLPNTLNAQQYGDLLWQASINDGKTPSSDIYGNDPNNAIIPDFLNAEQTIPSADVNWIKEIMQVAPVQSYNLTMSKGDSKSQQSFGIGYYNQEGIIKNTGYERYSVRLNSSYQVADFLTIGENFTASYKERVSVGTNSALGSIVYNALQFPSIIPVKDNNGDFAGNSINDLQNPLGELDRNKDNADKSIQAIGNIFATVKLGDFSAKTSLGMDYQNNNSRDFSPIYDEILAQNNTNSLSTSNSFNYQLIWTNTLNYSKKLGLNNINLLLGQEAIKYYYEGFGASRQNFLYEDDNFRYLSNGTENQLNYGNANEWALSSYFAQIRYNYDEKYLFTATVRRDGTSRLANNNYGTFPAFSAGWRVDREDFFDLGDTFTSFLIRGSWGQTGNQQLPSYSTVDSYSNSNAYSDYSIGGGQNVVSTGLTQTRVPNPDLKWETTTGTTIGVDLGFWDDKLELSAEYYTKKTDDILIYNIIPLTYGGTNDGQWINDGKMENKGFELNLNYSDNINDFGYAVGLNFTTYKNELTELDNVPFLGIPSSSLHSVNFDQEVSRSAIGQPIGSFYGYKANGLFQSAQEVTDYGLQPNAQPGDIRFVDIDENGVLDDQDRTFIGSPHPDVLLGMNLNFNYKNLDLGMFFNGSFGNDLYNLTKYKTHFFNQSAYNKSADLLNAWTAENTNSSIPRLSLDDPNNNIRPSSFYVENGSYIKLNMLQLGYTFNQSFMNDKKLRVYIQSTNVFTITDYSGMNPQIGLQNYSSDNRNLDIGVDRGIYPPSRTFTLGLNLKF